MRKIFQLRIYLFLLVIGICYGTIVSCGDGSGTSELVSVNSLDGASNVPTNSTFRYAFSNPLYRSSVSETSYFIVQAAEAAADVAKAPLDPLICDSANALPATVACDSLNQCDLTPVSGLNIETRYTICLTDDISYLTGQPFEGFMATFTTVRDELSTIGGSLSGLDAGEQVVLQNNGGDTLTVTGNVAFEFATQIASGGSYDVSVIEKPARKTCTVSNGAGTVSDTDITSILIDCPAVETGIIITFAGDGTDGYSGDGGWATDAEISAPIAVAVDSSDNVYFTDGMRVRKVDTATSIINTFAGSGTQGYSGDGGLATSAALDTPGGLAFDSDGNLFIADSGNNRIRRVDNTTGIITTVAGNGSSVYSGDGGSATSAGLTVADIQFDSSDNLYLADWGNNRIRQIDRTSAIITTVAGNGTHGWSGDGGQATDAELANPQGLDIYSAISIFYIADTDNCRIREVNQATGIITTTAGTGVCGFRDGSDHYGLTAEFSAPERLAAHRPGPDLYISDSGNDRIRNDNLMSEYVTTIAGTGTRSYSGDGGLATEAALAYPKGIVFDSAGNLYIADYLNNRIRMIGK